MFQLSNFYITQEKLIDILKEVGINVVYQTATELVCYCSFHKNMDTPAFNISKQSPYPWNCHNGKCNMKGYSILSLLELKGFSEQDIKKLIKFGLNNYDQFVERIFRILDTREDINEWGEIDPDKFQIEDRECGYPAKLYLGGRNIGEQAYRFFGLGYSAKKKMLVVPIYDAVGNFVGIIGRSIHEKQYQYSHGLQRKSLIWNLNNARKYGDELILTEGSLDAIYIWQAGFKNVGAVFGSSISEDQLALIRKYFRSITCFFDNDDAGNALANSIVENVHDLNVSLVRYKHEGNDPGNLTPQEINEMMLKRVTGIEILLGI